jgi:hypothetical protein
MDLRDLMASWPYDPDNNIRRFKAPGGREVLQVRLPLGIEQYELKGRPDGQRPYNCESALDYFLQRLAEAERDGETFSLDPDECDELYTEGTLYYFRYLHLFEARDWAGTVRDTARNLQLFDLVHRYAEDEDDQIYLEQWRPYLLRMNAAARAMIQLDQGQHAAALEIVQSTIKTIEGLEELDDENFHFERERSITGLKEMVSQIEETRPVSQLELLERALNKAVESQHFERAAKLRDRIRALRGKGKS